MRKLFQWSVEDQSCVVGKEEVMEEAEEGIS